MANYRASNYDQTELIAVNLEDQLQPGTLEFAIHHLIESRVDTSIFDARYKNDNTGAPAYDPKVLLKIILLGYSRGLFTSRKISRACRENVIFMALSCSQTPDYSTLATFISTMQNEIVFIFRDILLVCDQENLLGHTIFAQDGCKITSNASMNWSGTIEEIQSKAERMEYRLEKLLSEHEASDKADAERTIVGQDRERKINKLTKDLARVQDWLSTAEKKIGNRDTEIKSNITDNQSALMRTSHGTMQGYNAQNIVDSKHQIVVHPEAFGNAYDDDNVPPVIDGAKENMKALGYEDNYFENKKLVDDTAYHSETNLKKCAEENLDAYIPDLHYHKRDPRRAPLDQVKSGNIKPRFSIADFQIDIDQKKAICPASHLMRYRGRHKKRATYYYCFATDEEFCANCQYRKRCLSSDKTKSRYIHLFADDNARHVALETIRKLESDDGRAVYDKRMGIIEPVFANICEQKGFKRFTLRGKIKVDIQWRLINMVHNIEKIVHYGSPAAFQPSM